MSILISWLVLSAIIWLTAQIMPGIEVKSAKGAIITALIYGLINWGIGWLLFVAIGIATLGLGFLLAFITRLVVNALLLQLTGSLTEHLKVKSFGWAVAGAAAIAALGTVAEKFIPTLG